MRISAAFSSISSIIGTLAPMLLIIGLGSHWLWLDQPTAISLSWESFWPHQEDLHNLAFFSTILFGLLGIEMSAVHADDIKQPNTTYPKAILLSTVVILGTLVLSSLAIALVVPSHQLSVINALTQAFTTILNAHHLHWLLPVVGFMIILSGLGNVSAWIIGPTKGVLMAAQDGNLPLKWTTTNKHQVPTTILVIQCLIFTGLCSIFIFMPSIESGYWVLTAMTAQMGLTYYAILFATALRLRKKHPDQHRAFQIPGGKIGMACTAGLGLFSCVTAIILGFFPPERMALGDAWRYDSLLLLGVVLMFIPPLLSLKILKKRR